MCPNPPKSLPIEYPAPESCQNKCRELAHSGLKEVVAVNALPSAKEDTMGLQYIAFMLAALGMLAAYYLLGQSVL